MLSVRRGGLSDAWAVAKVLPHTHCREWNAASGRQPVNERYQCSAVRNEPCDIMP
jgi:hypothetical protein